MKPAISIEKYPPFRGCRFCLSLQNDGVFADFDVDGDGRVFLQRISFDGYGCCDGGFGKMSADDSRLFLDSLKQGSVASTEIQALLLAYFAANAAVIWSDALSSHGLL